MVFADWKPHTDEVAAIPRISSQIGAQYTLEYPVGSVIYRSNDGWLTDLRFSPAGNKIAMLKHRWGTTAGYLLILDLQGRELTRTGDFTSQPSKWTGTPPL